jgi:uncharacterized protein YdeI (BOF family)
MLKPLMATTAIVGLAVGLLAHTGVQAGPASPKSSVYKDNYPIRITGTVAEEKPHAFTLSYGEGDTILVEMDDWDLYDESRAIQKGEVVTVYGNIDQDLFEDRKIEASSVYAYNRNTYYFANDVDEEDYYTTYYFTPTEVNLDNVKDGSWVSVRGAIEKINGREFILNSGHSAITIDTEGMSSNPFDEEGYQRLKEGDIVYISGDMDKGFFEEREIEADQIITLYKSRTKP